MLHEYPQVKYCKSLLFDGNKNTKGISPCIFFSLTSDDNDVQNNNNSHNWSKNI